MGFNIFKRKPKPKPVIERIEVSEYGEPAYLFSHTPTLEIYREYNDEVSAPAIARDKKLKKIFGLIMGAVSIWFGVLSVINFDLFDYLERGRTVIEWFSYTGFMFYFLVFLMSGYLCFHLVTFYHFFPKRLEKATAEYYKSSKYLHNEIILACYEKGVLEKAQPRDEFFEWGMFNRCWESENVIYLEFNLANQLFVAKEVLREQGVDIGQFMEWANEHIEAGKKILAARETYEDEIEDLEKKLDELQDELDGLDKYDEDYEKDSREINAEMCEIEEKLAELKNITPEQAEEILAKAAEEDDDDDEEDEDEDEKD